MTAPVLTMADVRNRQRLREALNQLAAAAMQLRGDELQVAVNALEADAAVLESMLADVPVESRPRHCALIETKEEIAP